MFDLKIVAAFKVWDEDGRSGFCSVFSSFTTVSPFLRSAVAMSVEAALPPLYRGVGV